MEIRGHLPEGHTDQFPMHYMLRDRFELLSKPNKVGFVKVHCLGCRKEFDICRRQDLWDHADWCDEIPVPNSHLTPIWVVVHFT